MSNPFATTREDRHQIAQDWKERTGGKVIGLFCCNVPEEMISAAGMLPVRLLAEHEETTEADLHLPVNVCPYPKSCFDLALRGEYDYLDGLVVPNTCDIVRAMYGLFKLNLNLPYIHFVEVPQRVSPSGLAFFTEELGRFKASLEEFSGRAITDEALREAIALHNQNRARLRRLAAMRRDDPPRVRASEVQAAVIAATLMPKEEHTQLLQGWLHDMERADPPALRQGFDELSPAAQGGPVRLFLCASMLDDTDFVEMVEDCGGAIVADDSPMGSRYFTYDVDLDNGVLRQAQDAIIPALAQRYLVKVYCPRKMPPDERLDFLLSQLEGSAARGVIIHNLRACDCHLYEYPYFKQHLEERGYPVLFLKGEETEAELEQQRDEVEAFIEMLEG